MRTVAVTKIGSLRDPDEGARGRIGVVDFPDQPLGPEDVRIRVAYAAICGSDPHLAEGLNVHAGQLNYRAVAEELGYEYVPVERILA